MEQSPQKWNGHILPKRNEHEEEDRTHGLSLIRLNGDTQHCRIHHSCLEGPAGVLLCEQRKINGQRNEQLGDLQRLYREKRESLEEELASPFTHSQHLGYIIHKIHFVWSNGILQPIAASLGGLAMSPLLHQRRLDAATVLEEYIVPK